MATVEVTQEVFDEISQRIDAGPHPSEWSTNESRIFLNRETGQVIFQCNDGEDAERVLYALLHVIARL